MYLKNRLDGKQSKRGTSHDETVNYIFGKLLDTVQSEELANERASDRVFRINEDRTRKLHGPNEPTHAYDPVRMLKLNRLYTRLGFLELRYPGLKEPSSDAAVALEARRIGFQGPRWTKAAALPSGADEELLLDAFEGDGGELAACLHGKPRCVAACHNQVPRLLVWLHQA